MSTVQVKLAGVDRTSQVVFSSAYFMSAVNGIGGEAKVRFRDPDRTLAVTPGDVLELIIDGDPVWYGFSLRPKRVYVFAALNIVDFGLDRFVDVEAVDLNVLFERRIVFDQATPENVLSPLYPVNTPDTDAITDLLADWLDLSGDGLDTSSGVIGVGNINVNQKARPWSGADTWGQAMQSIASLPAAIYYLRPNKELAYVDTDTPDAPFGLSDVPNHTTMRGYREMEILLDGGNLANDVMTWGIGYGSSVPVFKRAIDAASVTEHGLWQLGQVTYGVYKQATIDRIADSILNGSPEHHRGSKDDRTAVILTTYEPGLLPAQKVPFESQVFGFSDVFPIRKMEVTFEAPDKPKYVMALSHEIDTPWSFFDPWKFKFPGFKLPKFPPWGPVIPSPPGCECGITDAFGRIVASHWGDSDAGPAYVISATSSEVADGVGILEDTSGTSATAALDWSVNPASEMSVTAQRTSGAGSDGVAIVFGLDSIYTAVEVDFYPDGEVDFYDFDAQFETTTLGWGVDDETRFRIVLDGVDAHLYVWQVADPQPVSPALTITAATSYGAGTSVILGGFNGHHTLAFSNLDIPGVDRCTQYRGAFVFDNFDNRTVSDALGMASSGSEWTDGSAVPHGVGGGVFYVEATVGSVLPYADVAFTPWGGRPVLVERLRFRHSQHVSRLQSIVLALDFQEQFVVEANNVSGGYWLLGDTGNAVSKTDWSDGVWYVAEVRREFAGQAKMRVYQRGTVPPAWAIDFPDGGAELSLGAGRINLDQTGIDDRSEIDLIEFSAFAADETPPCYVVCGPGPGGDCAFDALTDWTVTTNTADTGMETQVADDFIAARQIAGTTHTNSELAAITIFRDLSGDPNYTTLAQLGTYRFPYRIFGDYTLSDTPFPYARVRALVSLAASSVQVVVERNGSSGTSTTDDVTVTCPSGVGGTFTIPRTMDPGFIDIYVGVGTVTVTVQGVTQTYSPGAMTPDPDSAQMTANVQSTSTGTPLAEGRIGPMYFIPVDGSGVPWCTICAPGPLPATGHPVIGPGRELAIRIDATHYRTSWAIVPNTSQVWVDGALFVLGTDYTEDAPTGTLLFAAPVADTAVVSVTYTAVGPPPGTYPADTTLTYVVTPSASDPAYLTPYGDPTWFTTITRISNIRGVRQAYSRYQAWSKDSDFIMLPFTGGGQSPRLLDGTTYADLGTFSPPAMAVWSNLVNDKIFGVTGNQLIWKTMAGASTTIHTFSGYSTISLGEYEGGISDDDRYVALIGDPGGSAHLITYDILTDTIIADIPAPSGISDCQISRLGNYVTTATGSGIRRYPRDLSSFITLQSDYSHGDNALDASGREIFVTNNDGGSPQAVASYLLSTGAKTILISAAPSHQAFEYGHVSGHHNRIGWVYLSNYDETTTAGQIGCDQVIAVKTDGSQTVEVFGFAHHIYDNSDPTLRYACEPHATASRDGSRVIFASNWGNPAVYPYCYVARAA